MNINMGRVPYIDEEAYQWYESFDPLGEMLSRPNPTHILDILEKFIEQLVWSPNRIHFFGFGQGGSVAAELGLRWWKARNTRLGSIISIAGPLLSYPTPSRPCPTPILVYHRPVSEATKLSSDALRAFGKGYEDVREVKGADGDGMPRSREDWEPIMRFWSINLGTRNTPGLYEVIGDSRQQ